MFELVKNPLFRIIGVVFILYFALFNDKKNPESLGNLITAKNIKSELKQAQETSSFIISNINLAKELAEKKEKKRQIEKSKITITKIKTVTGAQSAKNGDKIEISYVIYDKEGVILDSADREKVNIIKNEGKIFDKLTIGMKVGEVISAQVPYSFDSTDAHFKQLKQSSAGDLRYQITLISIL